MPQTLISSPYWPHKPTPKQLLALSLAACRDLFYGGAAGGGKSDFLLMGASQFAHDPESKALLLRRTYADLVRSEALLDRAISWWGLKDGVHYDKLMRRFTFAGGKGGTIEFGHLGHSTAHLQYQGPAYTFIGIDESTQIPSNQIGFLRTRLRKRKDSNIPLQFRLAANPGGISHDYHKRRYVDAEPTLDRRYIKALLTDNQHLDAAEYEAQFEDLDPVELARLLRGDWSAMPSTDFFDLDKLDFVDGIPPGDWQWYRSWDYAATEEAPGKDPDYTAGGLVGHRDGVIVIADMQKFRYNPDATMDAVRDTARADGTDVQVIGEEEGGSSGKIATTTMSRLLTGYSYDGIRPTGSKQVRARALASAVRNRNVKVVAGPWVHDLVEEMRAFPSGPHDDQVDALSQAIGHIQQAPQVWIV